MDREEFAIEQYRALRAEILQSMKDGNQIIAFGLATIGLVVNAGIEVRESFFGLVIFAVLLPVVCALILSLWFAAQERTARASHYISGIESELDADGGSPSWEHWLRLVDSGGKSNHFWSTEYAAIGLLALIAVTSVVSSFSAGTDIPPEGRAALLAVSIGLATAIGVNVARRFRKWRHWLCAVRAPGDAP